MAEDLLADVVSGEVFRTCNGVVLHNLSELASYLDGCSDYDFRYHVNDDHGKNDFAIWVRESVGDAALADELDGTIDKDKYLHAVKRHVKELNDA